MVQLATGRGAYRDEQMRHDHFPTKWIYMVRAKGRNKMRVVRTKPDNLLSKIRGGGSQFHLVQFSQLQVRTMRTRFPVFKSLWWWTTRHAVAEGFKRFRTASFEITKDHEASKGSLKETI